MAQSKILSIDEQIQKLKEKRNREIAKMERNVGKKFIERFNQSDKPIEEIYELIETLSKEIQSEDPAGELGNGQSDK